MAIKYSPGCQCCDSSPSTPCQILHLTTTTGTTFNTTNWSSSGTPVYVAEDTIRIGGSGTETLTPQPTMSGEAYYVQFEAKQASGTLTFAQDTDTIVWDFDNDTCQVNAIAASNFNDPGSDWVRCNAFFCPSHSMGEARPDALHDVTGLGADASGWGTTTVDPADPTVDPTGWTLQASTTCEIRDVWFYAADVDFSAYPYEITEFCGFRDLFPWHYPYWERWTLPPTDADRTTETIDLTATGVPAIITARYPGMTTLFGNRVPPAGTPSLFGNWQVSVASAPNPQWLTAAGLGGAATAVRFSHIMGYSSTAGVLGFNGYDVGFGVFPTFIKASTGMFVERATPTQSTPYPLPVCRAAVAWDLVTNFPDLVTGADDDVTFDLVDVPTETWTLNASDGTTTVTWDHP